jgi:ribonuclease P protein component
MGQKGVESQAKEGAQALGSPPAVEARALRRERLPRSWRLARKSDLRAVLHQGHRLRTPLIELYWMGNEVGHPRLGLIVPRFQNTAVARNRLRRRLREIVRRRVLPDLPAVDLVVRSKPEAYQADRAELESVLERWARSLTA